MSTPRLIERWLPIAALGEESVRERRSMTALPPTYYLHVWWARRPLVASRAAVLASLLPADADRERFTHVLGIHGDAVRAKRLMDHAKRTGVRVDDVGDDDGEVVFPQGRLARGSPAAPAREGRPRFPAARRRRHGRHHRPFGLTREQIVVQVALRWVVAWFDRAWPPPRP